MTCAIRVRDYTQLRQAIAARRRSLGLRQIDADQLSSLQSGYFGKIEAGMRHLGKLSLPMVLAALDADIYLIPRSSTDPVHGRVGSASKAGRTERRSLPPTGET